VGGEPATISFTVWTLGNAGTNFTNSITAIGGNYTEAYYFNSTQNYAELLIPCATASKTNCQNGMSLPAYRIRNTGNVNANYYINISSSLSGTGFKMCANSSKPTGSTATVVALCDLSSEGNLNASSNLLIGGNVPFSDPNYEINITIYLNNTNVVSGTMITRLLGLNSTT